MGGTIYSLFSVFCSYSPGSTESRRDPLRPLLLRPLCVLGSSIVSSLLSALCFFSAAASAPTNLLLLTAVLFDSMIVLSAPFRLTV